MKLLLVALLACSPPARQSPPSNKGPAVVAVKHASDEDALVALVLERFLASPDTMPDAGLLAERGPIYVLAETADDAKRRVNPAAFPDAPRAFVTKTLAELEREAEATQKQVAFIAFGSLAVTGDGASVSFGVDIAIPKNPNVVKMCCCALTMRFVKRNNRWMVHPKGDRIVSCG